MEQGGGGEIKKKKRKRRIPTKEEEEEAERRAATGGQARRVLGVARKYEKKTELREGLPLRERIRKLPEIDIPKGYKPGDPSSTLKKAEAIISELPTAKKRAALISKGIQPQKATISDLPKAQQAELIAPPQRAKIGYAGKIAQRGILSEPQVKKAKIKREKTFGPRRKYTRRSIGPRMATKKDLVARLNSMGYSRIGKRNLKYVHKGMLQYLIDNPEEFTKQAMEKGAKNITLRRKRKKGG